MLVAITGATGFVGNYLAKRHISNGDSVQILTRRPSDDPSIPEGVKVFNGDLLKSDETFLASFVDGAEVLYHCAGEIFDLDKMYDLHINGTRNLCKAATRRVGRWVQLSSVGAYGKCQDGVVNFIY